MSLSWKNITGNISGFFKEDQNGLVGSSDNKYIYIVLGIIVLITLSTGGVSLFLSQNKKETSNANVITITPSITKIPSPTEEPSVTPIITKSVKKYYATPTTAVKINSSPTLTPVPPTNTPAPTNTPIPPTRTPNPPVITISYPTDQQTIEFTNSSQNFCLVDSPSGGNTEGIQRKHNLNNGSWTSYADLFTLCFEPNDGQNQIQLQYKNKYGDESSVYTRQFIFHRLTPTPTVTPTPSV